MNNDSRKQTSRYVQTLCRPKVEEIPPVHQISPTASQIIATRAQEPVFSALCHLVSKLPHLQLFTQPAFLQNPDARGEPVNYAVLIQPGLRERGLYRCRPSRRVPGFWPRFERCSSRSLLFAPRFILWWKICVNRGFRLHFLLWAPQWKQKHESTRVCAHTHTYTHTRARTQRGGSQASLSVYRFIKLSHEATSRTWEYRGEKKKGKRKAHIT